jgi:hypothetical protein
MTAQQSLRNQIVLKYCKGNPRLDPELVGQIVDEVADSLGQGPSEQPGPSASPFAVSWMDAYLAHWILGQQVQPEGDRLDELAPVIRELMDTRFSQRLTSIREWIGSLSVQPDGGPSEPGTPDPPDGGPSPEPGTPEFGAPRTDPPDGGPPEPGTPPVGPLAGLPNDNPWILYWFVSVKLPMLVEVMDAHLERRLSELGFVDR